MSLSCLGHKNCVTRLTLSTEILVLISNYQIITTLPILNNVIYLKHLRNVVGIKSTMRTNHNDSTFFGYTIFTVSTVPIFIKSIPLNDTINDI